MKDLGYLPLAGLLHDIGKFRMRHTHSNKPHQEHSYAFVNEDFSDFFSPCGDTFRNAIRHHHPECYPGCRPTQLPHLIEKLVILADRLSASEREDEEREREYFGKSALVSPMSRLKCSEKEYRYPLTALNLNRDTMIPAESVEVDQDAYTALWQAFTAAFGKITEPAPYSPAAYQTIVALLRKYTSRMPSSTPSGQSDDDISLYDHLRTTAAIAACLGRELTKATEIDALLRRRKGSERKICTLIKGDLSGIQNFLYHILSDGAARQLRGRSFYLQLLTEAIAHYVLRAFDLPITNLLLSSGGHFYILAPYSEAEEKLDGLRQRLSEKLWTLHRGDLACILGDIPITADDFSSEKFADKWDGVSTTLRQQKQQKWSELGVPRMHEHLFTPYAEASHNWKFDELGRQLRDAEYLIAFEVGESPVPASPDWQSVMRAFGLEIHLRSATDAIPSAPHHTERAIVYDLREDLREQGFLTDEVLGKFQWEGVAVSYDFRALPRVIARKPNGAVADYDDLANASEGVKWLGALRMDVDNLGTVFKEKLRHPTLSRTASLSESLRHFFEGYVPELCDQYNKQYKKKRGKEILELIYAGGDDLFLVGGWSALPEIARRIRCEFREFVTGDHVTLSGGIAIEHRKFPLYQFAERSGEAEDASKARDGKDALTFLRKPMAWSDVEHVRDWHEKFLEAMRVNRDPLPSAFLTQLNAIYADDKKWAWRSIYYFSRLKERYKTQAPFLDELRQALNHETSSRLRDVIDVITRWTALRVRN